MKKLFVLLAAVAFLVFGATFTNVAASESVDDMPDVLMIHR